MAFFKYKGGKRRVLPKLLPLFPRHFAHYTEPFVGAGSVAEHLLKDNGADLFNPDPPIQSVTLNDLNPELMVTWREMLRDAAPVIVLARAYAREFLGERGQTDRMFTDEQKEWYRKFQNLPTAGMDDTERAARFLFILCAGFNGVFKLKPCGAVQMSTGEPYEFFRSVIYRDDKLADILAAFRSAKTRRIFTGSYADLTVTPGTQDEPSFVYCDPPYIDGAEGYLYRAKLNRTSTEPGFFGTLNRWWDRGCLIGVSNNDDPAYVDAAERDGWHIHRFAVYHNISAGDNITNETYICNYANTAQRTPD